MTLPRRSLLGTCAGLLLAAVAAAASACGAGEEDDAAAGGPVLRVGHFPNVTHVHGVVAHALSREGRGWFEERLGGGTRIDWSVYKAGPSAMEALLAGAVDLTYVGPSPALNAYVRSEGADVRVVSGAVRGGSALVVHGDGGLAAPGDFRGRRVATPQFGNTQDVAARSWLQAGGLRVKRTGGDVFVIPMTSGDQYLLFLRREIDAVWTVEPWVSRLERELSGRVLVDDRESATTVLVASARALRERPREVRAFVEAHRELTQWIQANDAEAKRLLRREIKAETFQDLPPELIDHAWPRIRFDDAVDAAEFAEFVRAAQASGFLEDAGSLDAFVRVER